ncbi:prolyl oligopeptidase family serine peptidase [Rudaea sp.]|uniref:prolyl oligopeptidase family serine peptidase n=1 Tax=Rudaea sp. TaxID=2136325 RepID=UPI002ED0445D
MHPLWIALAAGVTLAACSHIEQKPTAVTQNETSTAAVEDPYLWLEETDSAKALDWVKARNAESVKAYGSSPEFEKTRDAILEVMDSDARIPYVSKMGAYYYNFWKDKANPRGLWRRTTFAEYRKEHPQWETLIDVDALGRAEGVNWVWHGSDCLKPEYRHCLVFLSRGGADASVMREFDLTTKTFVKDGFALPEAKLQANWINKDRIYVGTDFGPGSMTKSSYPRIVKEWRRGTPLADAAIVYEGKEDDLSISAYRDDTPGFERDFVSRAIDFWSSESFLRDKDGKLTKIDIPLDAAGFGTHREWMTVQLRKAWAVGGNTYASGSLIAIKFDDFIAGKREFAVLFAPSETTSLAGHSWTRHHLILNAMHDVVSHLEVLTPPAKADGEWKRAPLGGAPALSTISAGGIDADASDAYFLTVSGFLEPTTLYMGTIGQGDAEPLKHSPSFFDASKYAVQQNFATSKDGTRVPYFVIAAKDLKLDGTNPTLLYGYGGFEISLQPSYSGSVGRAWLSKGGVYVLANIRGGGEYGPRWHQAALKANRLRAYEDFAAVAEDLFAKKITSQPHLGAMGGSNGGLLMGNMLTLYPQLWSAIVCQVPLLDMKRYTHLSAGASWMAEYGDPDKAEDWVFIKTFSPYQNVEKGKKYPPTLFTTSTRDDRVGPHQARKMAARMLEYGNGASFYENIEGGHGAAADNKQAAFMSALGYEYLWDHLK